MTANLAEAIKILGVTARPAARGKYDWYGNDGELMGTSTPAAVLRIIDQAVNAEILRRRAPTSA